MRTNNEKQHLVASIFRVKFSAPNLLIEGVLIYNVQLYVMVLRSGLL